MKGKSPCQRLTIQVLIDMGAVLEIQDGNHGEKHPKSGDYVESGIPFIMAKDVGCMSVDLTSCKFLPREKADKLRIGFSKTDDVLLTHKGTVGNVAIVPDVDPYVMLTPQVTYYRVDSEKLHNRYLAYAFLDPRFQTQLESVSAQSTRPYIGITAQRRLDVAWTSLPTQRKIAAILSAYDDLIENNTRRIALLEQTAHLLYREWFVHFRFPGHESVPLIDSELGLIPQEWEVKQLGDVVELAYGKGLVKKNRIPGPYPVYGSSGIVDYHNQSLVDGPGIIVGRKGNVGSVFWSENDFYPIDTVFYVKTDVCLHYVYYDLQHQNFLSTDTAVPGLSRHQAYLLPFLLPESSVMIKFQKLIIPIFQQLVNLRIRNDVLRQTRDLLLPRLISGQLDVSELEINGVPQE